ncbi:MAG: glycosyltransferase [bacterium]|nr:glycosyltransferase [bacterium]
MHLVINALCINNRSGTGRYVHGLLDGLIQLGDRGTRVSALIPADFHLPSAWGASERVRFYTVAVKSAAARVAFEQFGLARMARRLKADVLHSPAFVGPIVTGGSFKQAVTVHDLAFLKYPETIPFARRAYYRWAIPRSIARADLVITDANAIADEVRARWPKANVQSSALGVSETFTPEPSPGDRAILEKHALRGGYVLFVGTREPRKNLKTLLAAYSIARTRGVKMTLALAGRYGWMQDDLSLDAPGVKTLGFVDDTDLPALYRGARALAAPSLYEGFDLPAAEALACGAPLLASDIAAHREILKGCELIDPRNMAAWVEALARAAEGGVKTKAVFNRSWKTAAEETLNLMRDPAGD